MSVSEAGSVTEVSLSQPENALDGITVMLLGKETLTSLVAPEKEGAVFPLATLIVT